MDHILKINDGFETARAVLQRGGLVAVPTETVYGLAADATNARAVAAIYKAKGRPGFNPLIAHVSSLEMAELYGVFDDRAKGLAEQFWPGPLTLVVPQRINNKRGDRKTIAKEVTAGLDTIALRHPLGIMERLAAALDAPIAAPSANTSGRISPTLASHVVNDLGRKVDLVLDNGPCAVGVESTIIKVEPDGLTLLREGGLAAERIEQQFGELRRTVQNVKIEAPGMLLAHYAPGLPVRLNAQSVAEQEALLYMGNVTATGRPLARRNLSPGNNPDEAARNLFAMLQELDNSGATAIAIQPLPTHGLGAAINDRLKRAAQGANQQ